MKLTKSKLQQIIKEELNSIHEGEDWYSDEQGFRPSAAQEWLNTQNMTRVGRNDSVEYIRLVGLLTIPSELGFPPVEDSEAREMIDTAKTRYAEEHPGMEPSTEPDPEGHRKSASAYYDEIGNTRGT